MKFLSFLDITCCALLCALIVFKLQATDLTRPEREGKAFYAQLQYSNLYADQPDSELLDVQISVTGADSLPAIRRQTHFNGETIRMDDQLVITLPNVSNGQGDPRQYAITIKGKLQPGTRIEVVVSQPSEPTKHAELIGAIARYGSERIEREFEQSAYGPLMAHNARGVAILSQSAGQGSSAVQWLSENFEILQRVRNGLTGFSRRVLPASQQEATTLADHQQYHVRLLRLLEKSHGGGAPANTQLQEITLNHAIASQLCGRAVELADLKELFQEALGEEDRSRNGFATTENLFTQVSLYWCKPGPAILDGGWQARASHLECASQGQPVWPSWVVDGSAHGPGGPCYGRRMKPAWAQAP